MKRALFGILLAGLLGLAGCGGGSAPPPAGGGGSGDATLAVRVIDSLGAPVAGATLRTASVGATTDNRGAAELPVPAGSEQLLVVERAGYAEQVRLLTLPAGTRRSALQVMLIAREAALTITDAQAGGSVSGKDGVKVTLPADALVDDRGQAVTGAVALNLTPVDVTQLDVDAFPGAFEGIPQGGSRGPILSFGTAELVPTQGGRALQLAAGKTARIELPLYVRVHADGTEVKAGDTIALWSLDADTGLWTQEGTGNVVRSSGSPTGFALRATIGHFSWWNADAFAAGSATVRVTVNVPGAAPPADTRVQLEGRVVAGSGPQFAATVDGPIGTAITVAVPSAPSTTQLQARVELSDRICTGSVSVSPAAGTTTDVTVDTQCADVPAPRILRPGALVAINSARDLSVQVLVDGPRADRVEVFVDGPAGSTRIGDFNANLQPQPFFTAFWDSSGFAEGAYTLRARATRDGISRDSATVPVVVDRTPPEVVQVTPEPGSEVASTTTFTLRFSEPVNPLPFRLADVVRLTVTRAGANAPDPLLFTASLDASGTTLTVQAQAAMPLGEVGLSWGALSDAAGNAVAGTLAATYVPARQQPLFATPAAFSRNHPAVVIDANGLVVSAWAEIDGLVRVARHEPGGAVLLGAAQDNPVGGSPAADGPDPALLLDAADEPILTYRRTLNGITEIVVRRFAGGAWVDGGPPVPVVQNLVGYRLKIDGRGRLLLALLDGQQRLEVLRLDAARTTWTSLGLPAQAIGAQFNGQDFDLDLMPGGDIVVSLVQVFAGANVATLRVARHDGSGWSSVGSSLASVTNGFSLGARVLGAADGPWVVYSAEGNVMRLARFDGSQWVQHDLPRPANALSAQHPHAIALLDGAPLVAYNDFGLGVLVTRFVDGRFDEPFAAVGRPSGLELAVRDGQVVVGAQDFVGTQIAHRLLFP